jgi:hypothetical protein
MLNPVTSNSLHDVRPGQVGLVETLFRAWIFGQARCGILCAGCRVGAGSSGAYTRAVRRWHGEGHSVCENHAWSCCRESRAFLTELWNKYPRASVAKVWDRMVWMNDPAANVACGRQGARREDSEEQGEAHCFYLCGSNTIWPKMRSRRPQRLSRTSCRARYGMCACSHRGQIQDRLSRKSHTRKRKEVL